MIRAVIDTNVLFDGLTQSNSDSNRIVQAWRAKMFEPFYSDAVAYEYYDVLGRKLSKRRWLIIKRLIDFLLVYGHQTKIAYRWRPASSDPGDDLIIECTMNANAIIVTFNTKDFRRAEKQLGIPIYTPSQFVQLLAGME